MEFLSQIQEFVSNNSGVAITVGAVLLEILFRLVKSDKVQSVFRLVPKVLAVVASILSGVANILDKAVPDRE